MPTITWHECKSTIVSGTCVDCRVHKPFHILLKVIYHCNRPKCVRNKGLMLALQTLFNFWRLL